MTPAQRRKRNELERLYLADLHARTLRAKCPRCGAKPRAPCVHDSGPRRGRPMASTHATRRDEANRLGPVKGPAYWRSRR